MRIECAERGLPEMRLREAPPGSVVRFLDEEGEYTVPYYVVCCENGDPLTRNGHIIVVNLETDTLCRIDPDCNASLEQSAKLVIG
jgi:hypothetical protein